MGGTEVTVAAKLRYDRQLDLGAIAKIVMPPGVAESSACEVTLASAGKNLHAELQSLEFAVSQATRPGLGGQGQGSQLSMELGQDDDSVLRAHGFGRSDSSVSSSKFQPSSAATSSIGTEGSSPRFASRSLVRS